MLFGTHLDEADSLLVPLESLPLLFLALAQGWLAELRAHPGGEGRRDTCTVGRGGGARVQWAGEEGHVYSGQGRRDMCTVGRGGGAKSLVTSTTPEGQTTVLVKRLLKSSFSCYIYDDFGEN